MNEQPSVNHLHKKNGTGMFCRLWYVLGVLFLMTLKGTLVAQELKFTATVSKNRVAEGEQFRLTYSVNTNATGFTGPDLSAFDVYSGPNQNSSMQIINGNFSQTLSYFYILAPRKEGRYTIEAATIQVGNGRIRSNAVEIEVVKGNAAAQQQQRGSGQAAGQEAGDNLFIRAIINKSSAYIGEQLTVTYKIYSRYGQISFSDLKFPTFNGFYTEEIQMLKNDRLEVESYNGSQYYTAELKKTVLFPQKSGRLEIPTLDATCVVKERVQPQSIFDQLLGGSYRDVQVKIRSKPLSIDVLPLPATGKPADFKGAVGQFGFSATVDKNSVKSGDGVTLKINVNGKGNLKLVETPELQLPPEFEVYDPQPKNSIQVTDAGMSGSRTFEYLLIPRAGGDYKLGPFSFSYFDPAKHAYQTITAPGIQLSVEKGSDDKPFAGRSGSPTSLKVIGSDIRFNKLGTPDFEPIGKGTFFLSPVFYGLTAVPPIALIGLLLIRRRKLERSANSGLYRIKEAGSMAQKRLRQARLFLKDEKQEPFYEEVFRAMYGYLGDKLQIPVARLSKETVREQLHARQVPDETVDALIRLLDRCEMVRYAPGSATGMQEVYADAGLLITRIESQVKP